MANRLAGKEVATAIKDEINILSKQARAKKILPKLGIIRVGENPDDIYYEKSLKRICENLEIGCEVFAQPENIKQEKLEKIVNSISKDSDIHGMLLFSPLPKSLNEAAIRAEIDPEKDVDSLTLASAAKVYVGDKNGFAPCTAAAVMELLDYYKIPIEGKKVTVLGRSLVVGKPLAMLLLGKNATVTICHSRTENLPQVCQEADILIVAVGRAKMVDENYVNKNQIVIDVGINSDPDNKGKMCGDVNYEKVKPLVKKITPVPGGVGSITSAVMCKHVLIAALNKK